MRRFVPIRAEGALVLGLLGVIAGGTYVINNAAEPTVTTRTTYGQPTVRISRVDQGGVKPGPLQPRTVQPVVAAPAQETLPMAPVKPVKQKSKKTVVATTPAPVVATPAPETEPAAGGILPGSGSGSGSGTGTGSERPGGNQQGSSGGSQQSACILPVPLCTPGQSPTVTPSATTAATAP